VKVEREIETLDPRPVEAPEAERRPARRYAAPRSLKAPLPRDPNAAIDAPLTVLHGVGPETAGKFERLGIKTLRDLLLFFPRRYDNYARMKTINRLVYGEECSVLGTVYDARVRRMKGGHLTAFKVVLSDTTGMIEATFFNQDHLARYIRPGQQIVIAGKVNQYLGRLILQPKEWEPLDQELLHTGRIVPLYSLTQGITQHNIRKLILQVVDYWARKQPDPLPAEIVQRAGLMPYPETLAQIHYPNSDEALAAAQHRLAFDELLLLQLGVLRQRRDWQAAAGVPLATSDEWLTDFLQSLPYTLTSAQQRALGDIRADLARNVPMNRLLQGDVGSGKTAVAAAAMAIAAHADAQAALMAPTSILAEQHYHTLSNLLAPAIRDAERTYAIRLLQGSTPASEKEEIYAGLRSGEVKVVIGTHALIESPVEFANLGLAIVDEQHRFGVAQRAALRGKGSNPHLLVMTATPIPRSLALTIYGDLDLSVLDEMPPGRQPIETHLLRANEHERGYAFIRSQLQKGRQAFIIFPLIEESEKIEAKAAVDEHARLQKEVFPDLKLGLLHGRLRPDEKDEVMSRFRAGEYHALVSTSVVEVGVDVPNAAVILIEGANRFGLAQLHQFRGRVGRGEHKSYCLLASDDPTSMQHPDERLLAMEQTQDGFVLAEKDLNLRGPGDFLGTRQSGFAGLMMAKLGDLPTIEKARREARRLFEADPDLLRPEHRALAEKLTLFWTPGAGDVS
jgi:ATP-dependent DNA helicase RecG